MNGIPFNQLLYERSGGTHVKWDVFVSYAVATYPDVNLGTAHVWPKWNIHHDRTLDREVLTWVDYIALVDQTSGHYRIADMPGRQAQNSWYDCGEKGAEP